ncbi:MAG: hypothetical protein ABIP71_00185, partial [Verrucomicrobiota bacterium]
GSEGRVGLKPLDEMKRIVREEMLGPESSVSPEVQARIRTKLGISTPVETSTNTPPVAPVEK